MTSGTVPRWHTEAEVEIRSLVQRYSALGDGGRFDELLDLFTDDAVVQVSGEAEPYEGHDGLRRLLSGANDDLRSWCGDQPVHVRHFTSTHTVELHSETEATGRLYYQCLMPHGLDHWGRYVDRYRKDGGVWRFAARREARDGMVEGGWCWHLWGPEGARR